MSKKIEIILNEIGKEAVNNLLKEDRPINLFNFQESYFYIVKKHRDKETLIKYIMKYDLNYQFLNTILQSIIKYYPEMSEVVMPFLNLSVEGYPLDEKDYKKNIEKFNKQFKKKIMSKDAGDEWENILKKFILNTTKFIKKNFSSEHIDGEVYRLEKNLKDISNISGYKKTLEELDKLLYESVKTASKSGKSKSSFLSSFFSKDSDTPIDEGLREIIAIFVRNLESFLDFDQSIKEKVNMLQRKVDELTTKDNTDEFKKILKEIFFKLEFVKNSIEQEKEELKDIIFLMADSFKKFVGNSSNYAKHLDDFIDKLKETDNLDEIKKIKFEIIKATIEVKEKTDEIKKQLLEANNAIKKSRERLEKLEQELEKTKEKTLYDGLTKAYNRAVFDDRIVKEIAKAKRENKTLFLVMIDIDHFKNINDTYGHQTGDMVLKILTQQIKKVIRDIDFFARYGGEEFSLILPDLPLERAKEVAERIRVKIEKTKFLYKQEEVKVTISLGMAQLKNDDDAKSLIERADKALYQAKNSGRNRVVLI